MILTSTEQGPICRFLGNTICDDHLQILPCHYQEAILGKEHSSWQNLHTPKYTRKYCFLGRYIIACTDADQLKMGSMAGRVVIVALLSRD